MNTSAQLNPLRAHAVKFLTPLLSAPSRTTRIVTSVAITLTIVVIAWVLYLNGGVRFALVHIVYLPIIVSALVFGVRGGAAAAIFAGLLVGPYMPLDASGTLQSPQNWLLRLVIFLLVGMLTGTGASILRRQLKRMTWLQEHDPITGLLNQSGLLRKLREMIAADIYPQLIVAVTQLRSLLEIQNTFGPDFCERLLPLVTERKRSKLPPGSLIALTQNDRIVIVITKTDRIDELRRSVEEQIKEPYVVNGIPVHLDFSIGSAHYPEHAREPADLLKKAGIAVQWAIKHNVLIAVYDSGKDSTSSDNMILLGSLPAALTNNELQVWYQAKRELRDGKIVGTEALLRWKHPERGIIPPGNFIPQAEETALINPLTHWVIDAALSDMAEWRKRGHALGVAINLSVRNLRDAALPEILIEHTRRRGLDPRDIELEITESAVMDDFDHCIALITRLRDIGFRVSIDDFGTGHSSLAYLKRLPISAIKIDQTFVKTLVTDQHNQEIVKAILHLAKAFGLETIAEGVEDMNSMELLRQWGCDYAQGFAIHKPAPSRDLIAWIEGIATGRDLNLRSA